MDSTIAHILSYLCTRQYYLGYNMVVGLHPKPLLKVLRVLKNTNMS